MKNIIWLILCWKKGKSFPLVFLYNAPRIEIAIGMFMRDNRVDDEAIEKVEIYLKAEL